MTVVFCTYQSLELVARAQDEGAPPFDLALCDEAHRTTGVDRPGDRTSPFVLVHDAARIRARKRLYMTATPRLYTAGAKAKAARRDAEVFSMDDPATFGPELHRLPCFRAVEQGLLSDYEVAILAVSERAADGVRAGSRKSFNRPSMLQHVDAGRRTEIDALNGALVREARALGVPVPANEALVALLKGRELARMRAVDDPELDYDAWEARIAAGEEE